MDIVTLFKIQREIDESNNDKEKIRAILSKLSQEEKKQIIEMYKKQINNLNDSIENYKNNIIKERKKITQ